MIILLLDDHQKVLHLCKATILRTFFWFEKVNKLLRDAISASGVASRPTVEYGMRSGTRGARKVAAASGSAVGVDFCT